ncbi:MAG: radical SAM protein [Victivallales bacterium]
MKKDARQSVERIKVGEIATPGEEPCPKGGRRVSGTKEWSHFTMSIFRGCDNACSYCWSLADKIRKNKHKQDTITKDNRHIPLERNWKRFMNSLRAGQRKFPGASRIMFPATHDITPVTVDACLRALKFILDDNANHEVLIVSKPRLDCVKRLCTELEPYKPRILFRFTIGSADDVVLKFWEPNAPSYRERLESLKYAFENGFRTSISCEPPLDGNIENVADDVYPFVTDGIWIGSANHFKDRIKTNGCWDPEHEMKLKALLAANSEDVVKARYAKWKDDGKIRWKDELKKIIGLASNASAGLDR